MLARFFSSADLESKKFSKWWLPPVFPKPWEVPGYYQKPVHVPARRGQEPSLGDLLSNHALNYPTPVNLSYF
jgi:hypothetical protein